MACTNYLADFAGIQYLGIAGISIACKKSVIDLIHSGNEIEKAKLLTCSKSHCFLLRIGLYDYIAVKSGFTSGYSGEGPRALSYVLQLLDKLNIDIKEYDLDSGILERLDQSCLTVKDIEVIKTTPPIEPQRWYEYINDQNNAFIGDTNVVFSKFPHVILHSIVDVRLHDLALSFKDTPDNSILSGYRRLEDIVRERTGLEEHSTKLFSKVFLGNEPFLTWEGIEVSEKIGFGNLFTSTFMAYRNRRAHREIKRHKKELIQEFLLLNHLYSLESRAVPSK